MKKYFLSLFLLFFSFSAAFSAEQTGTDIDLEQEITASLENMARELKSPEIKTTQTIGYIQTLSTFQSSLSSIKKTKEEDLERTQTKLNALGPAPQNDETEKEDIAVQRTELEEEKTQIKTQLAQVDLSLAKIDDLNDLILKIRNKRLADELFFRQGSILKPGVFFSSLLKFPHFFYAFATAPGIWYQNLSQQEKTLVKSHFLYGTLIAISLLLIAVLLSWLIRRRFGYRFSETAPTYTKKVFAAISMFIARGMIPGLLLVGAFIWLYYNHIIGATSFGSLLKIICIYLSYIFIAWAGINVTFAPNAPAWRLIDVGDDKAAVLCRTLSASVILIAAFSFFQTISQSMNYGAEISYALKQLTNAVKACCIIWVSWRFLYNEKTDEVDSQENEITTSLSLSSKISLLISFSAGAAFLVSLLGYVRLAEYTLDRMITSAILIGAFYIFTNLLFVFLHQLLSFKVWFRFFKISRQTLANTEKWLHFLLFPVLILICFFILLAVWGVSVDIMLQNIKHFLIGFNIGDMHVSIVSLFLGILVFAFIMFSVRVLKNSLTDGKLSQINMDEGVKGSIVGMIGFFGFLLAVMLSISVMGGSFKGLAIVAGALSFGAGLGLQNIVNNFVSGIILLFERPIKIGDWVIVNGQEGIVKQINMRATHLETWNKATVIIPNSDILSGSLVNVTYKNKLGRVDVKVGVGYDSDVQLVEKTLLEIAEKNTFVLSSPAPFVSFSDLGENTLDFQLSCYTANISNKRLIANSIRSEILKRFKQAGISIPFPQRVLYLKTPQTSKKKKTVSQK